jgi:hypothetical protein
MVRGERQEVVVNSPQPLAWGGFRHIFAPLPVAAALPPHGSATRPSMLEAAKKQATPTLESEWGC